MQAIQERILCFLSIRAIIFCLFLESRLLERFPSLVIYRSSTKISLVRLICLLLLVVATKGALYFLDELWPALGSFYRAAPGGVPGVPAPLPGGDPGAGAAPLFASSSEGSNELPQPGEIEVNQRPNARANPFKEDFVEEPDVEMVKDEIRRRWLVHRRLGSPNYIPRDEEIEKLFDLKEAIIGRMGELNNDPFWGEHRLHVIRFSLQPSNGAEFSPEVLNSKLLSLYGQNPSSSPVYKTLLRFRENFRVRYSSPRWR